MKKRNSPQALIALISLLIATIIGASAAFGQQGPAADAQFIRYRVLPLPTDYQNNASHVDWQYSATQENLQVMGNSVGAFLVSEKWYGKSTYLPLGLAGARGSLNLQFKPCVGSPVEDYNDSVNLVFAEERVLDEGFLLKLYKDDENGVGTGQPIELRAEDFANAKIVEMLPIYAPTDTLGKVSGVTSSLPDVYGQFYKSVGGFLLGANGLPIRGIGLNQGDDMFTSMQIPRCDPPGNEFNNDLGGLVLLLPKTDACADGLVVLHEDDENNQPGGRSWPIELGSFRCVPPPTITPPTVTPPPPTETPEDTYTVNLPLVATGPDCSDSVIALRFGSDIVATYPVSSTTPLALVRMPINTDIEFGFVASSGKFTLDQPVHLVANNVLKFRLTADHALKVFYLHWSGPCGNGSGITTIDP